MTEQFHGYLCGYTFVVYMANHPFTLILTSAKLHTTGNCWVASLTNYNFTLSYKSGEASVDVDALSHIPLKDQDQYSEADMVWALNSNVTNCTILIETYSCNIQVTETLHIERSKIHVKERLDHSPYSKPHDKGS